MKGETGRVSTETEDQRLSDSPSRSPLERGFVSIPKRTVLPYSGVRCSRSFTLTVARYFRTPLDAHVDSDRGRSLGEVGSRHTVPVDYVHRLGSFHPDHPLSRFPVVVNRRPVYSRLLCLVRLTLVGPQLPLHPWDGDDSSSPSRSLGSPPSLGPLLAVSP